MKIGILALQGDYFKHSEVLKSINIDYSYVKNAKDLDGCSGLIIPGGESTAISKLLIEYDLLRSLKKFAEKKHVFGTCAGSIIMSNNSFDNRIVNLNCIDVEIKRNSWGAQIDSFIDKVEIDLFNKKCFFQGVFIRAPRILKTNNCVILGTYNDESVLVRNKRHLISTFHPELTGDDLIHRYFVSMINE